MDDILKSIRRIIRSDQDSNNQKQEKETPVQLVQQQEETRNEDDNLIRMKIHDQKRVRILEKKLQTIEAEYEQKLQLHRRKMTEYRRQNQELNAAVDAYKAEVDAYKSKTDVMSSSLKTAHDCLEKLQVRNKALKDKVMEMSRFEQGTAVLRTIRREFLNLYHPDRSEGDNISKMVRNEVYNEVNEVLQGVETHFQTRRA
ncbi:MAG: hypothetical protein AAF543_21385 [Pseudomonadota bacterium]